MSTQKNDRHLNIAGRVDFMFNIPTLTESETITRCHSVMRFNPASLFVKPCYVQPVASCLRNKNIQIGTVIGGPGGANTTEIKAAEARRALTEGATLLAVPVNVGYVRESRGEALAHDLHALSGLGHMNFAEVEVMVNPEWLTTHEILAAAQIAQSADIDILSVPIGKHNGNYDLQLVSLLRDEVGESVKLKGVVQQVNYYDLQTLFEHGLARLGIKDLDFDEHKIKP